MNIFIDCIDKLKIMLEAVTNFKEAEKLKQIIVCDSSYLFWFGVFVFCFVFYLVSHRWCAFSIAYIHI